MQIPFDGNVLVIGGAVLAVLCMAAYWSQERAARKRLEGEQWQS